MSVKRKASLERRVGQGVERSESAEAERSGSRSGEDDAESSSCSAMRRTRSSETAAAAAREAETDAAARRERGREVGQARSGAEQDAAHSDGGDMAGGRTAGEASCSLSSRGDGQEVGLCDTDRLGQTGLLSGALEEHLIWAGSCNEKMGLLVAGGFSNGEDNGGAMGGATAAEPEVAAAEYSAARPLRITSGEPKYWVFRGMQKGTSARPNLEA